MVVYRNKYKKVYSVSNSLQEISGKPVYIAREGEIDAYTL